MTLEFTHLKKQVMCLFGVQGVIGFQRLQNLRMTKTLMSLHILCKILSFLSPRRTRSIRYTSLKFLWTVDSESILYFILFFVA